MIGRVNIFYFLRAVVLTAAAMFALAWATEHLVMAAEAQSTGYTITGAADFKAIEMLLGLVAALVVYSFLDLKISISKRCSFCKSTLDATDNAQWDAIGEIAPRSVAVHREKALRGAFKSRKT